MRERCSLRMRWSLRMWSPVARAATATSAPTAHSCVRTGAARCAGCSIPCRLGTPMPRGASCPSWQRQRWSCPSASWRLPGRPCASRWWTPRAATTSSRLRVRGCTLRWRRCARLRLPRSLGSSPSRTRWLCICSPRPCRTCATCRCPPRASRRCLCSTRHRGRGCSRQRAAAQRASPPRSRRCASASTASWSPRRAGAALGARPRHRPRAPRTARPLPRDDAAPPRHSPPLDGRHRP